MGIRNQGNSFYHLDPESVMKATELAGFSPTGQFTQLNSYENRVFDVRLNSESFENQAESRIVAKFYRPGRWSKEAILEEHEFLEDLYKEGLTVAQPLILSNQKTVMQYEGLLVSFFPKVLGRLPQEFAESDLETIGKSLALLHSVGEQKIFKHRPILCERPSDPWENLEFLLPYVSLELRKRYAAVAEELFVRLQQQIDPDSFQRIHGDCHRGNLLLRNIYPSGEPNKVRTEFYFVDFDDSLMAPVVQDIWMLFSSSDLSIESNVEVNAILRGYETLRRFPKEQLDWIPALRGLRIINYATWIARRWKDPSFPNLFPQFTEYNYWAEEVEALEKIVWYLTKN